MNYKLLVSDLDGTLLNSKSEITDNIKKAVGNLTAAGKRIVISSGRCYKSTSTFERELGLDVPGGLGIGFNGGMIYETDTLRVLYERRLSRTLAMEIIAELRKTGEAIVVYVGERLIAEKETEEAIAYKNHAGLPLEILPFENITQDISKILVKGQPEVLNEIEEYMKPIVSDKINMFHSALRLLEFCDTDVHKGAGLRYLCEMLKIDVSRTIAVGDNANDVSMIEAAGLGIAVANSEDCVKKAADIVLPFSNDQDAIVEVISRYIL